MDGPLRLSPPAHSYGQTNRQTHSYYLVWIFRVLCIFLSWERPLQNCRLGMNENMRGEKLRREKRKMLNHRGASITVLRARANIPTYVREYPFICISPLSKLLYIYDRSPNSIYLFLRSHGHFLSGIKIFQSFCVWDGSLFGQMQATLRFLKIDHPIICPSVYSSVFSQVFSNQKLYENFTFFSFFCFESHLCVDLFS